MSQISENMPSIQYNTINYSDALLGRKTSRFHVVLFYLCTYCRITRWRHWFYKIESVYYIYVVSIQFSIRHYKRKNWLLCASSKSLKKSGGFIIDYCGFLITILQISKPSHYYAVDLQFSTLKALNTEWYTPFILFVQKV